MHIIKALQINLTFCKHVALHCATLNGDDTSSSADTPIHTATTDIKENLYNNILAHIFFGFFFTKSLSNLQAYHNRHVI